MARCPYCGRNLRETERYCWFCELDVSAVKDKEEKPKLSLKTEKSLLDDTKYLAKSIKKGIDSIRSKIHR